MKKIIIILSVVISTILLVFVSHNLFFKNKLNVAKQDNTITEIAEIIEDDCTDEYEYEQSIASLKVNFEEEMHSNSIPTMSSKTEEYVLRDREGFIVIYKINENNEEEEYEVTDIATDYLAEPDKINIKNGLKVEGKQELNKIIEDFE